MTLTDVATGWTECLSLLHRREVPVLAALQRALALFPFPILGIDTDNGGEFILMGDAYMLLFANAPRSTKDIDIFWLDEDGLQRVVLQKFRGNAMGRRLPVLAQLRLPLQTDW